MLLNTIGLLNKQENRIRFPVLKNELLYSDRVEILLVPVDVWALFSHLSRTSFSWVKFYVEVMSGHVFG